jgi:transcriptional regulator with XRE-family HTH domain
MSELNLAKIRKQREDLGIQQQEMAERLGMKNKSDYSRYENGKYKFKADHVPVLANALGVSIASLYTQKVTKIETEATAH